MLHNFKLCAVFQLHIAQMCEMVVAPETGVNFIAYDDALPQFSFSESGFYISGYS